MAWAGLDVWNLKCVRVPGKGKEEVGGMTKRVFDRVWDGGSGRDGCLGNGGTGR